MKTLSFATAAVVIGLVAGWENIPSIPSNRRSQFYLRHDDGAYKYGYDSGDGLTAKQISSADNQVEGFYSAPNEIGETVNVRYTSGVQGFVPEVSKASFSSQSVKSSNAWNNQGQHHVKISHAAPNIVAKTFAHEQQDSDFNSDASYKISYNTGDHAREENSDSSGNVQGRYSYVDEAGEHDLSYVAGPNVGFKVTGGSLSHPNGLVDNSVASRSSSSSSSFKQLQNSNSNVQHASKASWKSSVAAPVIDSSNDGSYSFTYDAGDHSRTESSDSSGNVQGRFSYTNEVGQHDLSYIAGADTGFVVTGGSLSEANGLAGKTIQAKSQAPIKEVYHEQSNDFARGRFANVKSQSSSGAWDSSAQSVQPSSDGSYSFSYNTGDHARSEKADSAGSVQGSYSYSDEAGQHDLSYIAGENTGFVVTGGSLAEPNELAGKVPTAKTLQTSWQKAPAVQSSRSSFSQSQGSSGAWDSSAQSVQPSSDGSYSFSYNTGDHARSEKADSAGSVQGSYSYSDEAGQHDLSYIAGENTGFVVTGGSLAEPNGLAGKVPTAKTLQTSWQKAPAVQSSRSSFSQSQGSSGAWDSSAQSVQPSSDGSYSFSYNTGDHARSEKADSAGSVQGSYSYSDEAGQHDLSYIAGENTGFVVTGGSLAEPNGLAGKVPTAKTLQTSWQKAPAVQSSRSSFSQSQGSSGAWDSSAQSVQPSSDGSYSFSYNTGDHARSEKADSAGSVQGSYSYSDEAGQHDLSYIAGENTGFVVTGGSLAEPNELAGKVPTAKTLQTSWQKAPAVQSSRSSFSQSQGSSGAWDSSAQSVQPSSDGSYSFSYNTGDHARSEKADSAGSVQGSYSYSDEAGQHDLSYIAGENTGFVVTGGSLAEPNGLAGKTSVFKAQSKSVKHWDSGNNLNHQPAPRRGPSNTDKSAHPTFTVFTTANANQKSLEYDGHKQAIVLGYLAPEHSEKHGYIYDTKH